MDGMKSTRSLQMQNAEWANFLTTLAVKVLWVLLLRGMSTKGYTVAKVVNDLLVKISGSVFDVQVYMNYVSIFIRGNFEGTISDRRLAIELVAGWLRKTATI